MTERKPIILKNVRLSYEGVRRPAESIDLMQPRKSSFTMTIPTKYSPLAHVYLWSAFMGGAIPATAAIVGHDPQRLLPAPGPHNRPPSLWDSKTLAEWAHEHRKLDFETFSTMSLFPRAAKPVRHYIEGGHFDIQPPGTVDPESEVIYFDGPPTGRFVPPMPRWGEADVSPFIHIDRFREQMREPWPHKLAVIKLDALDFSDIEARVLATMADKRVRGVIFDIDSVGGEIIGESHIVRHFARKPKTVAKKAPPAYLQHDPTKRHSRRRKGK